MNIVDIYTLRNNLLYSQENKLVFEMTDPEINCGKRAIGQETSFIFHFTLRIIKRK